MFEAFDMNLVYARLHRTIVRLDGEYVYIREIETNNSNNIILYFHNSTYGIPLEECDISYDKMSIGMLDWYEGQVYWTSRWPIRRWKVGLNSRNFFYKTTVSSQPSSFSPDTFERSVSRIFDMLNGNYRSLPRCITRGSGGLSQHFSYKTGHVYHKYFPVGRVNLDNAEVTLLEDSQGYRQKLEEQVSCIIR